MSYAKIKEMLAGNIQFLSTQISPWLVQYKCKNGFDLFNHDFGGDVDEKVKIMGYIHRRDAYVTILNTLEYEQTSIKEEIEASNLKAIPISRKWEIIENAFTRKTSEVVQKTSLEQSEILDGFTPESWAEARKLLSDSIQEATFENSIPLFAALWYNSNVERFGTPVVDDTRPCDTE